MTTDEQVHPMRKAQEHFNTAIDALYLICSTEIKNCDRIDLLTEAHLRLTSWGLNDDSSIDIVKAQEVLDNRVKDLELVKSFIATITWEEIQKKDWKNPIDDLVPDREDVESLSDLFDRQMTFDTIRPYGEKLENIHKKVMDDLEAIDKWTCSDSEDASDRMPDGDPA